MELHILQRTHIQVTNKKTIITISPFREDSEKGLKSISLCSNLHKNTDFYCVHKNFSTETTAEPVKVSNSFDHGEYDVCVQNVDPVFINKVSCPTVAFYEPQTEHQRTFNSQLSLADFIAVNSNVQKNILPKEIVGKAHVVSPSIPPSLNTEKVPPLMGDFGFYIPFMGETANLEKILAAYFHEFAAHEPVYLSLLATERPMFEKFITKVKKNLGIYKEDLYPSIKGYSNMDDMHKEANCCIDMCSSYQIQLQTLVGFRYANPAIIMKGSSLDEWCEDGFAYKTESYSDIPTFKENEALELYSGREECLFPISSSLAKTMREIFENRWDFMEKQNIIHSDTEKEFGEEKFASSIREIPCFQ